MKENLIEGYFWIVLPVAAFFIMYCALSGVMFLYEKLTGRKKIPLCNYCGAPGPMPGERCENCTCGFITKEGL